DPGPHRTSHIPAPATRPAPPCRSPTTAAGPAPPTPTAPCTPATALMRTPATQRRVHWYRLPRSAPHGRPDAGRRRCPHGRTPPPDQSADARPPPPPPHPARPGTRESSPDHPPAPRTAVGHRLSTAPGLRCGTSARPHPRTGTPRTVPQ